MDLNGFLTAWHKRPLNQALVYLLQFMPMLVVLLYGCLGFLALLLVVVR